MMSQHIASESTVVIASIEVLPSQRHKLIEAARNIAIETRREAGCLAYHFGADLDDENSFLLIEHWATRAALEAHFQMKHFRSFLGTLETLKAHLKSGVQYVVTGQAPVELPAEVWT